MKKTTITFMAAMAIAFSSHAQTAPTHEAFGQFFGMVALHINTGMEIQRLCPNAKLDPDLNAFMRSSLESSPILLALLDGQVAQTKTASEKLAPEMLENYGGCSGTKFQELEETLSLLGGELILRWIQQDF